MYKMIKYIKNELKHLPMMIIIAIIFCGIGTLATSYVTSKDVYYDNSVSNLNAGDMQDAIDEVFQHATDYNNMNTRVTALENNFLDKTYPIGSIYISATDSTASAVAARFGGTWEAYATGRTLIGMGSNGTDNYTTISTGGSSSTTYTPAGTNSGGAVGNHTLTTAEIPAHSHKMNYNNYDGGGSMAITIKGTNGSGTWPGSASNRYSTDNTGGGGAHNHPFTQPTFKGTQATINTLDPYITVYMWKRTA